MYFLNEGCRYLHILCPCMQIGMTSTHAPCAGNQGKVSRPKYELQFAIANWSGCQSDPKLMLLTMTCEICSKDYRFLKQNVCLVCESHPAVLQNPLPQHLQRICFHYIKAAILFLILLHFQQCLVHHLRRRCLLQLYYDLQ